MSSFSGFMLTRFWTIFSTRCVPWQNTNISLVISSAYKNQNLSTTISSYRTMLETIQGVPGRGFIAMYILLYMFDATAGVKQSQRGVKSWKTTLVISSGERQQEHVHLQVLERGRHCGTTFYFWLSKQHQRYEDPRFVPHPASHFCCCCQTTENLWHTNA